LGYGDVPQHVRDPQHALTALSGGQEGLGGDPVDVVRGHVAHVGEQFEQQRAEVGRLPHRDPLGHEPTSGADQERNDGVVIPVGVIHLDGGGHTGDSSLRKLATGTRRERASSKAPAE
jgi:hypothetical protein